MLLGLTGIRHSRTGRVLLAMRENERGAQAYGVSVVRAKLTAFGISGFVSAVGGALFIHHQQAFDEGAFGPGLSIILFTAAVIGGLGSLTGGVLGAIYIGGELLPAAGRLAPLQLGPRRALRAPRDARRPRVGRSSASATSSCAGSRDAATSSCPSLLADRRVEEDEPAEPEEVEEELVELVSEGYA